MAQIRWTNEAATWLGDLLDYIAQDSQVVEILGVFHGSLDITRYL